MSHLPSMTELEIPDPVSVLTAKEIQMNFNTLQNMRDSVDS